MASRLICTRNSIWCKAYHLYMPLNRLASLDDPYCAPAHPIREEGSCLNPQ
jgi:hypothetical protein